MICLSTGWRNAACVGIFGIPPGRWPLVPTCAAAHSLQQRHISTPCPTHVTQKRKRRQTLAHYKQHLDAMSTDDFTYNRNHVNSEGPLAPT